MNHEFLTKAQYYHFFQWMRLHDQSRKEIPLRLIPNPSLKCPRSDIETCHVKKNYDCLVLNFMGLFGVSAPLPESFVSSIHLHDDDPSAWKGLLELFSHRLYQLYYDAWKSKRPIIHYEQGIPTWNRQKKACKPKPSLYVLKQWFTQKLQHPVQIRSFYPKKVQNPSPLILGKSTINSSYYLGDSCESYLDGIEVIANNMPMDLFYFHQSEKGKKSRELWKSQFNQQFPGEFHVCLKMISETPTPTHNTQQNLGLNFWMGKTPKESFISKYYL